MGPWLVRSVLMLEKRVCRDEPSLTTGKKQAENALGEHLNFKKALAYSGFTREKEKLSEKVKISRKRKIVTKRLLKENARK